MKKLLLSVLTLTSFVAFPQWQATSITNTGKDCFYAFSQVLASDYGASATSLQASTSDGATWVSSNVGVPSGGLHFGTLNGTTLYAYLANNIYQSTSGNNWTLMSTAIASSDKVVSMAVISGTVMAVTNPVSGSGSKIYQLNGSSWAFRSSTNISSLLVTCIRNLNGSLWAGTTSTCVLKSADAGMTFTNSSTGMPTPAFFDKYIYCLAANSSTLFCGTYGGRINKSTNNGSTWSTVYQAGTGSSSLDVLDIYVMSASNILVASDSGFIYSTNGGTSFQKDNSGLNYANNENYLSHITATPNYIIASTKNGAIMRRPIPQIFSGITEVQYTSVESKLYPNPANNFVTVEASELRFDDNCLVKLQDILGREISSYEMKDGAATVDLVNFNKGIYTYTVFHKNNPVSKGKLVVN